MFITLFTRAHQWPLAWSRRIHSAPSHPISLPWMNSHVCYMPPISSLACSSNVWQGALEIMALKGIPRTWVILQVTVFWDVTFILGAEDGGTDAPRHSQEDFEFTARRLSHEFNWPRVQCNGSATPYLQFKEALTVVYISFTFHVMAKSWISTRSLTYPAGEPSLHVTFGVER